MVRLIAFVAAFLYLSEAGGQLPSWNDGVTRLAIVSFVDAVSDIESKDYVAPADRIAVFDNDGTLWSEQPLYVQFVFMLDQVRAAAPRHPEWTDNPAFKALMAGDYDALAELGHKPLLQLVGQANSGMAVAEYDATIRQWLADARHPQLGRPYTDLVYAPMQELLAYLRANGFRIFIVSGGSVEFIRPWAEQVYGVPPEQIIGSQQEVKLEYRGDTPVLTRGPNFVFVDDGPEKPVGLYRHIGKRPIAAFGNSDGDLQMLQVTAAGEGRRLMLLVHHDDAEREVAYDRESRIGRLDKALDEARARDWVVVSMKNDWRQIFP